MRAFIVRPFGVKEGIDFDSVEEKLLGPALDKLGISGRTTGEVIRQGNIRHDMFVKLLAADLVIADVSIHNANVFYELGIRHALRDRASFLIKSTGDSVPFDLLTDRYFVYDAETPEQQLDDLIAALEATLASLVRDSPVFQQLPNLQGARLEVHRMVPFDFIEEVEGAASRGARGVLQLLAEEAREFDWALEGLRVVGRSQFILGDDSAARKTWEQIQALAPMDAETNTLLATVYERLGELDRSDQLLRRIIGNGELGTDQLTEAKALLGRNSKTRWEQDWGRFEELDARRQAALRSPHLESSLEGYVRGAREDRNNIFSVLNAVMQAFILTELAEAMPEVWAERFETQEEAAVRLRELHHLREQLSTSASLAIESDLARSRRGDQDATWIRVSEARLSVFTSKNPNRVRHLYGVALAGAVTYVRDSSRAELERLVRLGVAVDNANAGIEAIEQLQRSTDGARKVAERVIVFAGHRIDDPNRASPRFPPASEPIARQMIRSAIERECKQADGRVLAISGAASGGDILFQEVCRELDIPAQIFLARPRFDYARECVQDSGPDWVERFQKLCDDVGWQVLSETDQLPRWLREKPGYSVLERSSHWILHSAPALADSVSLIALWDGEEPDGRGGTYDIIRMATERGFKFVRLDANELVEAPE